MKGALRRTNLENSSFNKMDKFRWSIQFVSEKSYLTEESEESNIMKIQITDIRRFRNERLPFMWLRLVYSITRRYGRGNVLHFVSECPLVFQVTLCLKKQCYFLKRESKTVVHILFKFEVYSAISLECGRVPYACMLRTHVLLVLILWPRKVICIYRRRNQELVRAFCHLSVQSFLCILIY